MLSRGLEPIIAVVILVAVTLVLAIGVVGWIMGWWGTLGGVESLQIMPYSYINAANDEVILNITNTGTATAYIMKIEVVGVGVCENVNGDTTIASGVQGNITASQCGDFNSGIRYQVRVYTKAGNTYMITLEARD